jgi:hypothetical protein
MFYCQTVWIVHMRRKYTIFNISSLFQKNSQEKRKKIKRRWVLTQNSRVLFVRETSLSHLPLGSGVLTLEKWKQGCVGLLIVDCWALLRLEPIVVHESCYSLPRSILLISGNIHLSLTLNSSSSFLCVYLPPSKLSVVHTRTTIDVVIAVEKARRHQSQLCSLLMISGIIIPWISAKVWVYDATWVRTESHATLPSSI